MDDRLCPVVDTSDDAKLVSITITIKALFEFSAAGVRRKAKDWMNEHLVRDKDVLNDACIKQKYC